MKEAHYKTAVISDRIAPWTSIAGMKIGQCVAVRYWKHELCRGIYLPVFYITPSNNIDADIAAGTFATVFAGVLGALDNFCL